MFNRKGNFLSNFLSLWLVLSGFTTVLFGQIPEVDFSDEIVVTADRIPTSISEISRQVVVFDSLQIRTAPVHDLNGLLQYVAGSDVQQRGAPGIQADLSIRGAGYEQTLILIDGVRVNDPQTGHHNLNVPINLQDIKRIEVLKGPGSRVYGPNAVGGVVNIVTKNGSDRSLGVNTSVGQNQLRNGQVAISLPLKASRHYLSAGRNQSDGFADNTDFEITTLFFRGQINLSSDLSLDWTAGHQKKSFGANSFYTPAFPNQWEETQTTYLQGRGVYEGKTWRLQPQFIYRENRDEFLLKREDPDFYHNIHKTRVSGGELHFQIQNTFGLSMLGGEYRREEIESNNLGNHDRRSSGFYLQHNLQWKNWNFSGGLSGFKYSEWDWNVWPGFDFSLRLNPTVTLFGSAGKAFRVPTFTEMYYHSPANQGNPDLREENAWSFEGGIRYFDAGIHAELTGFRRNSRNLIDWVLNMNDNIWHAMNIQKVNTNGIEAAANLALPGISGVQLDFSYTYLDSRLLEQSLPSKYAINHLRHQVVAGLLWHPQNKPFGINLKTSFQDRVHYQSHWQTDLRVNYYFLDYEVYLAVTNLFNQTQRDFPYVPLPGRWIKAGFSARWPF
ncbi:MAG: TonB-dependent receptor plug domain-containing protein [Calditrichia bacterium]